MRLTLCGSTRFKNEYQEANTKLSLAGHVVYSVAWAKEDESAATPGEKMDAQTKENLDLVHLAKILNSDAIVVVGRGEDGKPYVGSSTRREIVWAQMNGKFVYFNYAHLLEDWHDATVLPTENNQDDELAQSK
jgi:hypothetical protein